MKTNDDRLPAWQAQVNEQLWREIEKLGGARRVAEATGLNPVTFYSIQKNRSFVSTATMLILKETYPQVDWDSSVSVSQRTKKPAPDSGKWEDMYHDLYRLHRQMVGKLIGNTPSEEELTREFNFLAASSLTTTPRRIGYQQGFMPVDRGPVAPTNWPALSLRRG